MESISDLVKIPEHKKTSERAELIKFFVENVKDKKGKQFPAKRIAIALSHIKELSDLYYFKSVFQDEANRRGREAAQKYFWWSLKPKKNA